MGVKYNTFLAGMTFSALLIHAIMMYKLDNIASYNPYYIAFLYTFGLVAIFINIGVDIKWKIKLN